MQDDAFVIFSKRRGSQEVFLFPMTTDKGALETWEQDNNPFPNVSPPFPSSPFPFSINHHHDHLNSTVCLLSFIESRTTPALLARHQPLFFCN